MKYILIFLLHSITFNLSAQNLIPDSSFEKVNKLPSKKRNGVSCTKDWACPMTTGAGDYYHKKGKGNGSAPRNTFGRQKPHSGDAYGGMCIRKKFIEYLETKLIDSLEKDREYLVEFYFSRAERSFGAIKEIGVLFTDKMGIGFTGLGIPQKPSIEMVKNSGFRKKMKWMKFSSVYKAKGGESVIILGYFNYNTSKKFKGYSHYYVDDVSVTLINDKNTSPSSTSIGNITVSTKAIIPPVNETIPLEEVYFEPEKFQLLPGSFAALDKLAGYLKKLKEVSIEITGYTFNNFNENENLLLSELRAKAAAHYLISKGIHPDRITYSGKGSTNKKVDNSNENDKNYGIEYKLFLP